MDGVLNVAKPAGPTSHDIVDEVRRIFGIRRVGHAGTLDPMATGVLVMCLGKATRIVEYLMGKPKEYRARMVLGAATDTQDATGTLTEERDASGLNREDFERAAASFVGRIRQVPPMVSAVKHEGKRLYELAREGKTVEREAREVEVYSIEVVSFAGGARAEAEMVVSCASGTYIRTLCADIGERLGYPAHVSALERTASGRFRIEDSVTIESLREAASQGRLEGALIGLNEALADLPAAVVGAADVAAILHGAAVQPAVLTGPGETVRILAPRGDLLAIGSLAQREGKLLAQPRKVVAEPADRGGSIPSTLNNERDSRP